jgi:predicted glycosyltransferase
MVPRMEQHIRASRAAELGLVRMLVDDDRRPAAAMVAALRTLPGQPRPSSVVLPGLLAGLDNVNRLAARHLDVRGVRIPGPGRRRRAL